MTRFKRRGASAAIVIWCSLWVAATLTSSAAAAGPTIELIVGPSAPPLERFAADELAGQLKTLFAAEVRIRNDGSASPAKDDEHTILLGNSTTNPVIRAAVGAEGPKVSLPGFYLRTISSSGRRMLLVGGPDPNGTLSAVYELGHFFGLRSLLQGDFPPVESRSLTVDGFDVTREPTVDVRAWQLLDGGPTGWEAWSLTDYQRVLHQLRKLRFNQVILAIGPRQPFLHFEAAGKPKSTAQLFSGHRFPVSGDTAGRKAFQGRQDFENPDFTGCESYRDRVQAGVALVRDLIDRGHQLGLEVAVRLSPLEFPPEIAAELDGASAEKILAASVEQLSACLQTYPELDRLYLELPAASPIPAADLRAAWEQAIGNARRAGDPQRALRMHFVSEAAQPLVPIDLFQPGAGVLPQCVLSSLASAVEQSRQSSREGWVVRARLPSDAELGTYYLARAAWDPQVTPESAAEELITTIAGTGSAPRLLKGFGMVERAASLLGEESSKFASPDLNMVLQHAVDREPPANWSQVQTLYTDAMNEMYRGNTRAREGGRGFILYYARRNEFGMTYLTSLQALRKSALAKSKQDSDGQRMHLEAAVESMYNALNAFGEVARDPSDRGIIAVTNEFGYRPLVQQLQAVE